MNILATIGLGILLGAGTRIGWALTEVVYRVVFIIIGKVLDRLNGNKWEGEAKC